MARRRMKSPPQDEGAPLPVFEAIRIALGPAPCFQVPVKITPEQSRGGDGFFTLTEFAELLHLCTATLRTEHKRGNLTLERHGRGYVVTHAEAQRYLSGLPVR